MAAVKNATTEEAQQRRIGRAQDKAGRMLMSMSMSMRAEEYAMRCDMNGMPIFECMYDIQGERMVIVRWWLWQWRKRRSDVVIRRFRQLAHECGWLDSAIDMHPVFFPRRRVNSSTRTSPIFS